MEFQRQQDVRRIEQSPILSGAFRNLQSISRNSQPTIRNLKALPILRLLWAFCNLQSTFHNPQSAIRNPQSELGLLWGLLLGLIKKPVRVASSVKPQDSLLFLSSSRLLAGIKKLVLGLGICFIFLLLFKGEPLAFDLTSPTTGTCTNATTVRFDWGDSTGATIYLLDIGGDTVTLSGSPPNSYYTITPQHLRCPRECYDC
ncbi:MAG: hypothetical protein QME81_17890, partial [bacterium]|nr:hypothetical protein [bacterium]